MKKILRCFLLLCLCAPIYAQKLNVASYNIRYDNPSDVEKGNGWTLRYPVIAELVSYNNFDF